MNKDLDSVIRELAEKYLNEEGRRQVKDNLFSDQLTSARLRILGAIDRRFVDGDIRDQEASEDIKRLGLNEEVINLARASSECW